MPVKHGCKVDQYIRAVIPSITGVFFPLVALGIALGFEVVPAYASGSASKASPSLPLLDPTPPPPDWTPGEDESDVKTGQNLNNTPSTVLLPDLQTLPPADFRLVVDQEAGRKLLRFSNAIWNRGPADLELRGEYNWDNGTILVTQNIYRGDGTLIQWFAGEFDFHADHGHWHWDGFSLYEVWSIKLDGSLHRLQASSGKVGYCVRDITPYTEDRVRENSSEKQIIASNPGYTSCYWARQGLSVGWCDIYKENVSGQFVEISQLEDGIYALKSTVDPENIILEADDSNNSAVVYFSTRENQVRVLEYIFAPINPEFEIK